MTWFLATEDLLSSAVAEALVRSVHKDCEIRDDLGRAGNGKLITDLQSGKYSNLAIQYPLFLLTDLDQVECAPTLRSKWLRRISPPSNLVFRIAVRETEAWLMADAEGFSKYSGVGIGKLPRDVESVLNPKELLLDLVGKHGNRNVKGILPRPGSSSKVSPSYNAILCDFIRNHWSVERAATRAPSLMRAVERVRGNQQNIDVNLCHT